MSRVACIFALLLIMLGCGPGPGWKVYGRSGQVYQAPGLCEALVKCLKGNEQFCYFENWHSATGDELGCKEVKP